MTTRNVLIALVIYGAIIPIQFAMVWFAIHVGLVVLAPFVLGFAFAWWLRLFVG